MSKHKVAVYGTLRQGQGNHRLLNQDPVKHIEVAGFKMYSLGGFPAIQTSENSKDVIKAELYEVDDSTLRDLDRLEGYDRTQTTTNTFYDVQVIDVDGDKVDIYTMPNREFSESSRIENGDWVAYTGDL